MFQNSRQPQTAPPSLDGRGSAAVWMRDPERGGRPGPATCSTAASRVVSGAGPSVDTGHTSTREQGEWAMVRNIGLFRAGSATRLTSGLTEHLADFV